MVEQSLKIQQIINENKRQPNVLAVTSGKGGVGKTNVSANIGVSLAARGKKVLLVDADMSLGNLDVVLNVTSKYDISDMLKGRKSLSDIIHVGPEGVEMLCGCSGLESIADMGTFQRQRFICELNELSDEADITIIDTASGISKSVVSFCLCSNQVLVVTTPEATAMTDAYAMIKVLAGNEYDGRINLLVNMARSMEEGKKTYRQIATVASRFLGAHVYDAGVIAYDEKIGLAIRQRKPVVLSYPKSKSAVCFNNLATKLSEGRSMRVNENGFFRKVVDWFF